MKKYIIAGAMLAVSAMSIPASAATFILSYTANSGTPLPTTATITITTKNTLNMAGGRDILSASGTVNGEAITGLAPLNPAGFNTDNVFYKGADPVFTSLGLGYFTTSGTGNLWGNAPGAYSLYGFDGASYTVSTDGILTVAGVPEPQTWGLLILGFGMVGAAARRRSTAVAA